MDYELSGELFAKWGFGVFGECLESFLSRFIT